MDDDAPLFGGYIEARHRVDLSLAAGANRPDELDAPLRSHHFLDGLVELGHDDGWVDHFLSGDRRHLSLLQRSQGAQEELEAFSQPLIIERGHCQQHDEKGQQEGDHVGEGDHPPLGIEFYDFRFHFSFHRLYCAFRARSGPVTAIGSLCSSRPLITRLTRRFFARISGVSFGTMGWCSP